MTIPDRVVSSFLPPSLAQALVDTQGWSKQARHLRIDALTLQAHTQYPHLVRHPGDTSRSGEWAAISAYAFGIPDGIRIINEFE